ncbi:Myosin type-2 heavy chain 1, partial [Chytriomyces hyalinus]
MLRDPTKKMAAPPPPSPAHSFKNVDLFKALIDYKKGSLVYFPDEEDGWAIAEAAEDPKTDSKHVTIKYRMIASGEIRDFKIATSMLSSTTQLPPLKNPGFMDTVDDLSLLSYLHEPGVFWGIKNRFAAQKIYTYSGMVLIAVNPFERLNIYSNDIMREYVGSKRTDLEPHVYGIAEECYRAMLEGNNQSVIVSGESGAGKTQSTRYIMQYLAVVDSLSKLDSVGALMRPESMHSAVKRSETEDAVLASNPILESFGNAKTTRNDNSSRFGKFVELFFSDASSGSVRITGAKISLQKERNYHIFYQLCAAVPAAERKHLALDHWEKFHYLNQGNAGVVCNVNDTEEHKITMDALSTLGMSVATQWEIFAICAAVLHIGNIKITSEGNDGCTISNSDPAIEHCARLLGINKTDFIKWVTKKQTTVGKEKYIKDLKPELALVARDSVTKVVYTKLFDWLVRNINKSLKRDSTNDQNFIGVLDIYGFEHFAINSFEQFCINYANEKLQQEFNAHVFRLEQEGYIKEAIRWEMIEFTDNQGCIELIEGRMGIMALLDEDSRLPAGTDATFIGKLMKTFDLPSQPFFAKPRFGTTDFTIRHYAVDVTYTSTGFIDKNKDSMSDELKDVLLASSNPFFRDVFLGIGAGVGEGNESASSSDVAVDRRRSAMVRMPTLGGMFKSSLTELMDTIRATESHIRDFKIATSMLSSTTQLPPLKNPGFMDTVDDLSLLSYLHEPGVFWGIKNRFAAQKIYTYSGMVLIAVNPFERLNIYSNDIMREYVGSKRTDLEPHVYGIAEECYRAMLEGNNQSVIVSGESGAGKTQSTRYIMQYLAVVDSLSKLDSVGALMRPESMHSAVKRSETEDAVLASNPILESFGNAKTTRNDNSSRFGKFVELFFSDPSSGSVRITGAKVRTYLLERSRLIFQPKTGFICALFSSDYNPYGIRNKISLQKERNYHIFYQLCAAVPAAERKHLALDHWEKFHYLNQGNAGVVRNVNDAEEHKITMDALSTLGISVATQWEIFAICAAVLHIGNIKITSEGKDGCTIGNNDPAIEHCARLLGINKTDFIKWVTKKQTTVGKEKYIKDLKPELALVARDSVTKVVYTKLFDWLVRNINKSLKRDSTNDQNFIGVLDIYGFEHFAINSFEQFCINYANEKLQQEFNAHVFRLEQEGYIKEAIRWEMIEFTDNQGCIELIEGRMGIMALLDEDSRVPAGTDATFIGKLLKPFDLPSQPFFAKPRFGTTDFTIRHYAVDVTYTSTGFIDKNKDSMSDELKDVLLASSNPFFRDVFLGIGAGVGEGNESASSSDVAVDRRRSAM